jgi:hypothetical protein
MPDEKEPSYYGADPDLRFDDPRLHEIIEYWRSKRRHGRLPARADIDPLELERFLGDLFMLDVIGEPRRFRYRLIGTNIVAGVGRDSTGSYQEEVYSAQDAESNNTLYRGICATRMPMRTFGRIKWVGREFLKYECAYMPLADDGATVNIILGCMRIKRQVEKRYLPE